MEMQLQLPAVDNAELVAALAAETLAKALGLPEESLQPLRLAVIEACLNASEHGGGDMLVRMADEEGFRLRVEVEDHGSGFDPEAPYLAAPARKHGCVEKRGWGLRLIREMMDEVSIDSRPGRTIIRMWKNISPEGEQGATGE